MQAIKKLVSGIVTKEETSEYVYDEQTGKMKLVKQKIKKNTIPPNTDIIKLLYNQQTKESDYENFSDAELKQEKQKLIKQLKEKEDDS